ncbi:MAG TPA: sugar ABC transporter substrate-binding protein [Actinomycetota bacterium]|nr:sugar ABC transporter substrate-binding protein [Actinomycetota bacterium]
MRTPIACLAAVLLVVAGCSNETTGAERGTPGDPSAITLQVSGEREETAAYRAIVQAYENDHAGSDVELVQVAEKDDHLTKLATSFAAGDPPDVFLVNFREYSQFVARGAVQPIGDLLEERGVDLGDYYEAPVEAFSLSGELQCMPQNVSSLVTYYNVDLFQRAGVDEPRAGWTWEEFRATAEALTRGDVRGVGIEPSIIRVAPFVWSNGGDIVDDLDEPTRFTLEMPAARQAVEFVVRMAHDELIPTEREIGAQDLETRFVTGKLGMLLSSRRDTPAFREVRGLNWDVGPLPVSREQVGILHSDAYCISTGTNVEAAADFVAFAAGEQGQTLAALAGRTVPSLRSVSSSGAFLDPTQPPRNAQVFLDAVSTLRRTPVIPTWPEIEDVAEEYLTRAFYDTSYTVDRFIEELNAATAPLFAEGAEQLP